MRWVGSALTPAARIHPLADAPRLSSIYTARMGVPRHFTDTRTPEGRVRFLLAPDRVQLMAEGKGWQHQSNHPSLEEAANFLAVVPQITQCLYEQTLNDLERQIAFESAA